MGNEEELDNTCTRLFENLDSQAICDEQALNAGCDTPANWAPLTGDCTGLNCTDC